MSATVFDRHGRATVLAPRLQALLREHVGRDAFRLDADTVGVAGQALVHRLLSVRPATEHERTIGADCTCGSSVNPLTDFGYDVARAASCFVFAPRIAAEYFDGARFDSGDVRSPCACLHARGCSDSHPIRDNPQFKQDAENESAFFD
jgi:hypothetical protein